MPSELLCIYPDTAGGATNATRNILGQLKRLLPGLVEEKILKYKRPVWQQNSSESFRLLKNFIRPARETARIFSQEKWSNKKVYSPSLIVLMVAYLNGNRRLYYHYLGEHYQDYNLRAKDVKNVIKRNFYAFPIYFLLSLLEKLFIVRFEKIFVSSYFSKRQLLKIIPNIKNGKIVVVPYGCDRTIFKPRRSIRDKKLRLLYAGRVDPNKGIRELISALILISAKIDFSFTGAFLKTPEKQFEKEVIAQLKTKLPKKHKILWNASPRALARLYQTSDLTILPSYFEQFPLIFSESISCGTPLLSTRVGELTLLQPKISDSLLLKNPEPQTIATGILNFSSLSPTKRNKIRQKCILLSQKYSWSKSAEKIKNEIFN